MNLTLCQDLSHKDFSSDKYLILVLGQLQLGIDFQSCLIAFGAYLPLIFSKH